MTPHRSQNDRDATSGDEGDTARDGPANGLQHAPPVPLLPALYDKRGVTLQRRQQDIDAAGRDEARSGLAGWRLALMPHCRYNDVNADRDSRRHRDIHTVLFVRVIALVGSPSRDCDSPAQSRTANLLHGGVVPMMAHCREHDISAAPRLPLNATCASA